MTQTCRLNNRPLNLFLAFTLQVPLRIRHWEVEKLLVSLKRWKDDHWQKIPEIVQEVSFLLLIHRKHRNVNIIVWLLPLLRPPVHILLLSNLFLQNLTFILTFTWSMHYQLTSFRGNVVQVHCIKLHRKIVLVFLKFDILITIFHNPLVNFINMNFSYRTKRDCSF